MTESAIKAFQTANGLKATGIVDSKTISALDKATQGTTEWSDSIHDLITNIGELGGREYLIQSFRNLFDGIGSIIGPIKEAFHDVFSIDGSQILNFTKRLEDLTSKIKISDETADKLKTTFKGFFSVGQQVGKIAGGVLKTGFNVLGKVLKPTGGLVLNLTSKLGDALIKFSEWVDKNKIIFKVFDGINVAIDKVIGFIQNGIDKIKEFGSAVKEKFAAPGFETFLGVVTKIWETLKNVGSKIIEIAANIGSAIGNAFRSGDIKSVLDVVNGGIIASVLLGIRKYISGITEAFDGSETFIGKIKDLLDIVGDALQAWQQNIKAQTLIKIAAAIAVLAASLIALSLIDSEKLSSSLGAITVLFAELMGSLAIFNKMNLNFGGAAKAVTTMIGMSIAILILASAMKKLSSLSWEEIGKGIAGILGLTAILVAASKIMATEGKKVAKGALQMAIMAAALKILASVCKDLSELSWIELAKGLSGIAVLLAAISLFLNTAKFGSKAISTATGIVILAAALKILASVCKDFSTMKWEEIGKGLAGIAGLLFELAGFTNLAGNAKHVLSTGVALIVIAAAMKIFTNIMNDMSQMSWEEIAKGLTTVGGALLVIAGAMNLLPKGMVAKAVSLIGIAAAITILGNALSSLGEMSWEEIAKGLVALGGSLGILAGGLYLMNGSLAGSAALVVAAVAIGMLAPILKSLGDMSWLQIAKGLVALAGAIAIFGVAALVLTPIIPAMLGLGAAILVFGAGCALAGVGITAIATGLTALGATIVVTASSIVETINTIVKGLGTIITSFCNSVAESAPAIAEAFVAILDATCYTIKESIPLIAETFFELLVEALTLLKTYIPQLADLLADILISIMDSLAGHMPEFADSFANLIQQFVSSFSNLFGSVFGEIDLSGLVDNIGCISKALLQLSIAAKIISTIPITGALAGIAGFAIMIAGIGGLIVGIGALATEFPQLEEFLNKGIPILIQIGSAIGEFFGTIISSFAEEVISILPAIGEALSGFMTNISGFINGAAAFDSSKMEAIKTLAEAILILTGANLLDSITRFLGGKSSLEEFGAQLVPFGEAIAAFSETVSGKIDAEAVEAAANAGAMLAELASTLNRSDGLIQKIIGEKDNLKGFGEKLQVFGAAIVAFSSTVSAEGAVNKDAIQKACDATALIVDLANTLPSDNGWFGKVFGDKDTISGFGSKLIVYANSLASFCVTLANTKIDIGKIEEACTATGKIVELAETLPQDPGWFASVFGGGTDLEKFGEQIASLGTYLSTFNGSIQDVDVEKMSMAVANIQLIADIASGLNGIDFGNMENLGKAFGDLGSANIQAFINAFTTAGPQLNTAGANAIQQLINGITSKQPAANQAAVNVISSSVTAASNACNGTYRIGQNFVEGFISGIDSLAGAAAAAAANMASGALTSAQRTLQIRSPSRKMIEMGENTDRGYIIGLKRMVSDVYEAGGEVGKAAKSGIEDTISKKYDDVKKFFGDAPNKVSAVLELDTSSAEDKASKFWNSIGGGRSFGLSGDISNAFAQNNQNESKTASDSTAAPSYSFTQNNYSPKALSRIDIYRQTKNQFSGWIFNDRIDGGFNVEYDEIKLPSGNSLRKRK